MYSFKNDYSESAHPRLLQALIDTNLEQADGYGMDSHSLEAQRLMKQAMEDDSVDIHLISGGTQTNLLAISAFLRAGQAVISADSGHIAGHEGGAIEATGHKILTVPSPDGKITPEQIAQVLLASAEEFTPRPALVYLSNSTEFGTVYSKQELTAISEFCRSHNLILFVDGARLASALCCEHCGLTLADMPRLADAFYIGGTKNGALLGEALVICRQDLKSDFRRQLKLRGAMLAKGKVMGVQFEELFRDGLYFQLGRHANAMADRLRQGLAQLSVPMYVDSPSNQLFPILCNQTLTKLDKSYGYSFWQAYDENRSVIRLVTSWATQPEKVDRFLADLKTML